MSDLKEITNKICYELPEDWSITLELERDSGWVELINPYGDKEDFPSNLESMEEALQDALEYAKLHEHDFEERYLKQLDRESSDGI